MREIQTPTGSIIRLYNGTKELPMDRFNELKKYILRDTDIGSSMSSIDRHYHQLDVLLANEKFSEAKQERINLHTSLFLSLEKINIGHISFALFVESIDGKQVISDKESVTEDELIRVCRLLESTKLKQGDVEDILHDLKKKMIPNWISISPSIQTVRQAQTTTNKLDKKPSSWLDTFRSRRRMFKLKLKLLRISRSA